MHQLIYLIVSVIKQAHLPYHKEKIDHCYSWFFLLAAESKGTVLAHKVGVYEEHLEVLVEVLLG